MRVRGPYPHLIIQVKKGNKSHFQLNMCHISTLSVVIQHKAHNCSNKETERIKISSDKF